MRLTAADEVDVHDLLYGTEIRSRHAANLTRPFERLIEAAKACDANGMIVDAVLGSAHGLLYKVILQHRAEQQ